MECGRSATAELGRLGLEERGSTCGGEQRATDRGQEHCASRDVRFYTGLKLSRSIHLSYELSHFSRRRREIAVVWGARRRPRRGYNEGHCSLCCGCRGWSKAGETSSIVQAHWCPAWSRTRGTGGCRLGSTGRTCVEYFKYTAVAAQRKQPDILDVLLCRCGQQSYVLSTPVCRNAIIHHMSTTRGNGLVSQRCLIYFGGLCAVHCCRHALKNLDFLFQLSFKFEN